MKKIFNNEKFKIAAYGLLIVIFIAAIIVTIVKGINVGIYYAEGTTIKFTVPGEDIDVKDIKGIADEIWDNQYVLIEKVELFNDSISIKVNDFKDEDVQTLCDKLNEKYGKELKIEENFYTEHISNVRLRSLILPYIMPLGISLLLILGYYAIRFKGTKEMIGLIKYLVIFEGLLYSSLAICRIPFGIFTMPVALIIYLGVVVIYTAYNENKTNA